VLYKKRKKLQLVVIMQQIIVFSASVSFVTTFLQWHHPFCSGFVREDSRALEFKGIHSQRTLLFMAFSEEEEEKKKTHDSIQGMIAQAFGSCRGTKAGSCSCHVWVCLCVCVKVC
jgi:hypothetical protein